MGELHVMRGEIQALDAKTDHLRLEFKGELVAVNAELREMRRDINYLIDEKKDLSGFSRELDTLRSDQVALDKRVTVLEHQ